ncbi:MAG: hypothetical protein PHW74_14630 [Desulfobacca sp.]|nr:hypothetical protein [Desulfobacca sp.]
MVRENEQGAYLGLGPGLKNAATLVATDPHFDVLDWGRQRLILGKCSRLPDDQDLAAGRYGIDFHRALPPFQTTSGYTCDWGEGPITVNAYNYARYLPRSLRFREFTANLAFAAQSYDEFQAKCRVYRNFYNYQYNSPAPIVIATPHSGQVHRPPDDYHPFPHSEIDAWTARVAAACAQMLAPGRKRVVISLHSTDYFGSLIDIGDFGLPQNGRLPRLVTSLQKSFAAALAAIRPAYGQYILPYTQARLKWIKERWGTVDPSRLASKSTAARFEIHSLIKVLETCLDPDQPYNLDALLHGLEQHCRTATTPLITLNGIFSGRKTARLLNLAANLQESGIDTAIQVECSRFLARDYPALAAAIITALIDELEGLP